MLTNQTYPETDEAEEALARPPRRRQDLRVGFSTGTAAAAASQGALREWLGLPCPESVEVTLPGGGTINIPLHRHSREDGWGLAAVIKDAGDDPDVTNGAEIGARVRELSSADGAAEVVFRGGAGVGRVTKPGLALKVGEPAINPVPRRMIRAALLAVWDEACPGRPMHLEVEIFVPRGAELARHTLNPRLGILGGISILGTTGLVKPFSHAAYRATILAALRVAGAAGLSRVVFSTGGKSEELLCGRLPELPPEAFVQMGDYVRFALKMASHLGFQEITVGAFFGKALKIAQGKGHTHASRGLPNLTELAVWTLEQTGDPGLSRRVARANTARQTLEILTGAGAGPVVAEVGRRMLAALRSYAGPGPELAALILDFSGPILWQGESPGAAGAEK
jgi:cobalt-precorrin-5B (C1)-methyltransferase